MNSNIPIGTAPDDKEPEYVGAPAEIADSEEMPAWVALIVEVATATPYLILLGLFLGACLLFASCVLLGGWEGPAESWIR